MIFSLGQLLLPLVDLLLVFSDQCKSGIWIMNPDKMNTRLEGPKIRTFDHIPPRLCFDKCIRRPRCHSYNYNRHILRCELNYKLKPVSVEHFQNEVGFVYVDVDHYRGDPIYDTCLGNPCKSGEVCESKKDGSVFCIRYQENEVHAEDCTKLNEYKHKSRIYTIFTSKSVEGLKVFCNMKNGGWTVIQRRIDGRENFKRTWVEYENGFGNLRHEFWLGNKYLDLLTSSGSYKLRVELVNSKGENFYAEYSYFKVYPANSYYSLEVNGYSGNAGHHMSSNIGCEFSTYDRGTAYCARHYGAWWHCDCSLSSALNSPYNKTLRWKSGYIKSDMMIQRTG
ncbi:Tenascin-X,Fibrinogen-like protein A,Tenascin,Angiopoietin-4 [Mytilus coruscus]|uniref:Tenascin-X,Fibrinogen-like protein A,Tenascin,Angiopoietin-4 n=1 Tax=Mytilus coruscus TaxID=42192 RepID=A0A6J8CQY0_MYTCO|nr:Tenascin-X,Fibrinogen-like protein A,Tenascin,Angiopoietin-4 [Mytilus coruscus]